MLEEEESVNAIRQLTEQFDEVRIKHSLCSTLTPKGSILHWYLYVLLGNVVCLHIKVQHVSYLNSLTPMGANNENSRKIPNFVWYLILKYKWYHAKVLPKRFHLNGHTIGFRRQAQKVGVQYILCLRN